MGRIDRALGRELRLRRTADGDTLDTLAARLGVSDKTIGKWERGVAMPSATNIRMLEKLGLIEGWLGRNGSGGRPDGHPPSPEAGDRIMQTLGFPESELRLRVQDFRDAGERELVALFRTFPTDERSTILQILHLVVARPGAENRLQP
ncbi:MAG: helix-turn-helix domain-containing protein [Rhodospirillaceae bacterium]|nr:helix-turn-helix domain-containing protein [Rhodospirillaceae bacterium]